MDIEKLKKIQFHLEINANVDWDLLDPAEEFAALAKAMKEAIPTPRDIMVKNLGQYISEDDVEEALTLLEEQSEKDGSVPADNIVLMWEPLCDRYTVDELLNKI